MLPAGENRKHRAGSTFQKRERERGFACTQIVVVVVVPSSGYHENSCQVEKQQNESEREKEERGAAVMR